MTIEFDNQKHETLVNDEGLLSKKYRKFGPNAAGDILTVVAVLRAAGSLFDIPPSYRPHPLTANLKGLFAVDVDDTHRVIFKPNHYGDTNYRIDNYKSITKIVIIDIYHDYHRK